VEGGQFAGRSLWHAARSLRLRGPGHRRERLGRRHIRVDQIRYIGKESNSMEDVESGLIHAAQNVYTEYPDPRRDEWQTKLLPIIKKAPLSQVMSMSGMSRRWTAGGSRRSPPPPQKEPGLARECRKRVDFKYARPRKEKGESQCPTKTKNVSGSGNVNTGSSEMRGGESFGSPRNPFSPESCARPASKPTAHKWMEDICWSGGRVGDRSTCRLRRGRAAYQHATTQYISSVALIQRNGWLAEDGTVSVWPAPGVGL